MSKKPSFVCENTKNELLEEKLVIIQCFVDGNFLVCDPGFGKTKLSEDELSDFMGTPFGKTYISVSKK